MKKYLTFFLFLITFFLSAEELYINGNNNLQYIYKTREDSLNNYLDDEFGFTIQYGKFTYGMKFFAQLPRYNNFSNEQFLTSNNLFWGWKERFISFESDKFYALGGLYPETFGSGIVLSSLYDKDFDIDTRITGSQIFFNPHNLAIKGIYGIIKDNNIKNANNIVIGTDIQKIISSFMLGTSVLQYRKIHSLDNKYSKFNIYAARINYSSDIFETYLEYAKIKEDTLLNELNSNRNGNALYFTSNLYLKKFSFSAGYKKYKDFDIYINDPPRLNYSDEPLSENVKAGKDEEGFMGEIIFEPDTKNSFKINYSEAWNTDKTIKLSDAFLKYYHKFNYNYLSVELTKTERYEKPIKEWTKEIIPLISYDTSINDISLTIKSKYRIKEKVHLDIKTTEYEPFLQTDFSYKDKSLSFIFVLPFTNSTSITDGKLWIGIESKTSLFNNTNLTFFIGKEKGGKVCRNGVCKYQSQFSGIKLNLETNF